MSIVGYYRVKLASKKFEFFEVYLVASVEYKRVVAIDDDLNIGVRKQRAVQ